MTNTRIRSSYNKAAACKKEGYYTEALLIIYHLNIDLIRHILNKTIPDYPVEDKKIKAIVKHFILEISVNAKLKSIINKKNFKSVKLWLASMDLYFKTLKSKSPANTKQLLTDSEGVFSLLNISVNKLNSNKAR